MISGDQGQVLECVTDYRAEKVGGGGVPEFCTSVNRCSSTRLARNTSAKPVRQGALPGSVHDLTAARIWGIPSELAAAGLITLADKGYAGAGVPLLTPYRGRNKPGSQKDADRAHARLCAPGERAKAQLKTWRILRKLRCCPWRAGQLAKAIHVLQTREIGG